MKPLFVTLPLLLLTFAAFAQSPLIGIYEGASSGAGDNLGQPGVRVLFRQSGREWRSFHVDCHDESCLKTIGHSFPHTTNWTLVRSGTPVAKVTATTPNAYRSYSEIGVQAIDNPASVAGLEPRPNPNRPETTHTILATTFPTLTDPDNWRPFPPVPFDILRVRQDFRRLFPRPINCDVSGKQHSLGRPWAYTDDDIHVDALYQSNKNWRLLQVTLGGYRCDGPPDPAFFDQWFAISPIGDIHHIGQLMHLAGAADFAHDRQSALLFSTGDGYRLFYDDFKRQAQTIVAHH
jgi:hypothetical protein